MRLGGLNFGGPIMWFFAFLFLLAFGGAIYQAIDLARRKDASYDRWGRVVWMPIPLLFVFAVLGAFIGYFLQFRPVLTANYGMLLFALMVGNLIQLPAYLLRVAFPTPKRAVKLAAAAGEPTPQWALDALEIDGEPLPEDAAQTEPDDAAADDASAVSEDSAETSEKDSFVISR